MEIKSPLRIALVAGEPSGDLLGAGLITALKKRYPHLVTYGIAGPRMIEAGCEALYPMEELAVIGIIDPLKKLPHLLNIRRLLRHRLLKDRPDVFVGIDAPDFNLTLEIALRKGGIPVVHYVSPTIWAWREKRIHKIKRAVDLMLTLFPFESAMYQKAGISVTCVGHPLADQIPIEPDQLEARRYLNLPEKGPILALLPGSRRMEIKRLAHLFIQAAERCCQKIPDLQIIAAMVDERRQYQFQQILNKIAPQFPIKLFVNQSHRVMEAADVVLLASGTATLEAMLYKRPMVVGYRLSNLGFWILKRLVKTPFVALPNILAGKSVVPELLQEAATKEALGDAVLYWFQHSDKQVEVAQLFKQLHHDLKRHANETAADAILSLVKAARKST
jgi:lipid-A-disaccharide synthase